MTLSIPDAFMDSGPKVRKPVEVKTCEEYLGRMGEIREECEKRGLVPVYYYTLPAAAESIAEKGFCFSSTSAKDVGIYFTTSSPASYDVGCSDYESNLIVDMLDPEDVVELRSNHKFDVCFVYAAEPRVLRKAPGWRETSIMVPKAFMENFSEPDHASGDFFLRPDRIVACFLLDPAKPLTGFEERVTDMDAEKENDKKLTRKVAKVETEARFNDSISRGEHGLGEGQTPWPRMDMVSDDADDDGYFDGEVDPMIFGDGDFGVPDWASLLVDLDGAGGVKIRDLPQLPIFTDDQDPYTIVGLNVHLRGLELKALNDWTGVVKAWKSGDGKIKANTFTVSLDAGLPGFLPGLDFSCKGHNLEVALEQGKNNKPRPRKEALLKSSALDAELDQLDPKRRAIMRAKSARQNFPLLDHAETAELEFDEQEENYKTEERRRNKLQAAKEKKAKKRAAKVDKHFKSLERQISREKSGANGRMIRRISGVAEARFKPKTNYMAKQPNLTPEATEDEQNKEAAAKRMVLRLDEALNAWQVRSYGDAWDKWVETVLAGRANDAVAAFEAKKKLEKEWRETRRV